MSKMTGLILAGASLLALSGAAAADELSYGGGWPPGAKPTGALEDYAKAIGENSGGELTMRVFPLSLLSFAEANGGLRDGLADAAAILTPYFPAEFPNLNMVSEFSSLVELPDYQNELSSLAYAGATTEYIMLECDSCREEIAAQNQVFMGAAMTTSYMLQCVTPIETAADLQGKRIRTAGAYWARWAESVGAVPVSISINETFEALSQGVLDCTASNPADFLNFSFVDAVKHVYVGLPGAQFTVPTMINRERWQGLSEEARAAVMKANAQLAADMTWVYIEESRAGQAEAGKRGITWGPASDELVQVNQDFINADLEKVAGIYQERYGIENGAETASRLRELLGRWTELLAGADSADAVEKIYWDEIYSKVDVSTYGM